MTKISLGSLCMIVPMLLALGGCTVKKCKGNECDFGFDDAGITGGNDDSGSASEDAGSADAGDASGGGDAGEGDAGNGGDAGEALTLDEFCSFQLSVALAWRDSFDSCCTTADFADADRVSFLQSTFALSTGGLAKCAADRQAQIDDSTVVYDGSHAQACADAFAAQFAPPDVSCPAAGFDLAQLRADQGHGASLLVQIPACRETFVGTVAKEAACTDSFQCADGLRCLAASGSGAGTNKTCQEAVGNAGGCVSFADCEDGLTCIGSKASGLVCRPNDDLGLNGAKCSADRQCVEGLLCDFNTGDCADPVADVVCM